MALQGTSPERRRLSALLIVKAMAAVSMLVGGVLVTDALPVLRTNSNTPPRVEPEVPVTATDQALAAANNSPVFAADPTEARFVVLANRLDAPDFGCALQVSGDGGRGWLPTNPVPHLPSGAEKCYAPEVAFDADGVLYFLFIGLQGAGNEPMGAFLTTSSDRGQTFSAPRQILGPLNFSVRMAVDPTMGDAGRIHLTWLQATSDPPLGGFGPPPNPILAAHSDDGGKTFSEPVQVSDVNRERVVAPALALGPDHAVYVGYYDLGRDAVDYQGLEGPTWKGTWTLVMASSSDGGQGFGPGVVVDDQVTPHERVMLIFTMPPPALVADDGNLCVAWTDARNGDADAVARCSFDRGDGWHELRRLNDDAVGNGISQYLPRLALSPDGRLDAVFYDRRSNVENLANDVYYTYSTDGGRSFAANVRLNRRGFDSRIGQEYLVASAQGQVEFGSRLGLLARTDSALTAWTDTRHSVPETTAQDLFAAEIVFATSGTTRDATRFGGLVLLIAGVVVTAVAVMHAGRRQKKAPNP